MANPWHVGVILAIFASMAGAIGKQLVKFSELRTGFLARASMMVALVLMTVVEPLIDMASYAFAPQTLIAPLGALDVVWNTLLAPCTWGEKANTLLVMGCGMIASGVMLACAVGTREDKTYTIDEMEEILTRLPVLLYLLFLLLLVSINIIVPMQWSLGPKDQPFKPGNPIRGFSLGVTAGSIAGNMFCVKAFGELIQVSIKDGDGSVWAHWLPYVVLFGALFFAVHATFFLSRGMMEFDAFFIGSIFEGALIFFASTSGGIVFREFDFFTPDEFILYYWAIFTILGGIFCVAKGTNWPDDEESAPKELGAKPKQLDTTTTLSPDRSDPYGCLKVVKIEGTCSSGSPSTEKSHTLFVPRSEHRLSIPFRGCGLLLFQQALSSKDCCKKDNICRVETDITRDIIKPNVPKQPFCMNDLVAHNMASQDSMQEPIEVHKEPTTSLAARFGKATLFPPKITVTPCISDTE